jgi:hypothetical protein
MAVVYLSPVGGVAAQFFTNTGSVLTGGKLYSYAAGTTTPQATYTTNSGAVARTNPIILDAAGRVPDSGEIWITANAYKFVLKDSNDVLIASWDNINGSTPLVFTVDDFSGNGSTTAFTLSATPYNENITFVYVNGVYQNKNTYSVAGTTLTFSTAPPLTTSIEVMYLSSVQDVGLSDFTGNGSTVAFTLSAAPTSENSTFVFINGVYQQKNTYTIAGTTLTFSTAPPNTSSIEVVFT